MNRADIARDLLMLEQVAVQAKARAGVLREMLERDALAEYEEQGSAPTWRFPDVGRLLLPLSQEVIAVGHERALVEWVEEHRPDLVANVPTLRPGALQALLDEVDHDGQAVFLAETQEVVPGLVVRQGGVPKTLQFTPDPAARRVAGAAAGQILDAVAAQLGVRSVESTKDGEQ